MTAGTVCVSVAADNELADATLSGSLFQNCAPATGNSRPPTDDSLNGGICKRFDPAERSTGRPDTFTTRNDSRCVWQRWRRGVAVECRIRDQEVAGSSLCGALRRKKLWASFSHLCASVTKQYNLVLAWGRWCPTAGKVTAGLAESNGSLPPGLWYACVSLWAWWEVVAAHHRSMTMHAVTCRLTA